MRAASMKIKLLFQIHRPDSTKISRSICLSCGATLSLKNISYNFMKFYKPDKDLINKKNNQLIIPH